MDIDPVEKEDVNQVPVVTEMYTTELRVRCPHCNSMQDGFVINPAGHDFECDDCGRKYKIHPEADIEYGY